MSVQSGQPQGQQGQQPQGQQGQQPQGQQQNEQGTVMTCFGCNTTYLLKPGEKHVCWGK